SFLAQSKISSVRWVRERIPMKCASAIFSLSSASGSEPVRYSILLYPAAFSVSTAFWWTPSNSRNLILLLSRLVLLICVPVVPCEIRQWDGQREWLAGPCAADPESGRSARLTGGVC